MRRLSIVVVASDSVDRIQEHIDSCLKVLKMPQTSVSASETELVLVTANTCSNYNFSVSDGVELVHICELTSGIYAAMNTGAKVSTGEFLVFSNVGDTLLRIPNLNESFDIICASVQNYRNGVDRELRKPSDDCYLFPPHQGQFIKSLYFKYFYFNEMYVSASDLDLFLKMKRHNANIQYLDSIVASRFELGGVSNSMSLKRLCRRKFERIVIVVSNREILRYLAVTFNKLKRWADYV